LEGVTDIDLVVNLKLQEEALLAKCLGRRICNQCGGNFNIASISVKGENGRPGMVMAPLLPPAHCMSKLIARSDDTESVVKERLRIYNEKVFVFLFCQTSSFISNSFIIFFFYHPCRVSLWRDFTVVEGNCWSLNCQEVSQNLGLSCCKLLILMIMRRSNLLQHKIYKHTIQMSISFFACMHACLTILQEIEPKKVYFSIGIIWINNYIMRCWNLI